MSAFFSARKSKESPAVFDQRREQVVRDVARVHAKLGSVRWLIEKLPPKYRDMGRTIAKLSLDAGKDRANLDRVVAARSRIDEKRLAQHAELLPFIRAGEELQQSLSSIDKHEEAIVESRSMNQES